MRLLKSFQTGVLPLNSRSKIAVNLPPEQINLYSQSLETLYKIEGYQILELSDHNALLRANRDITFYSLTKRQPILELRDTRVFPFLVKENILFNYRKTPTLEFKDFTTAQTLWKKEYSFQNRIIQGICNDSFFVGNIFNSEEKICIDIKTGECLWKRNLNSFLKFKEKYAGNNYLVSNNLISLASNKDYFSVEAKTGEINWHLDLEEKLKMGRLFLKNKMFLFIREVNDVFLMEIDLIEGKVLSKELLTEQIQRLGIYPRGNTGTFGQLSYYEGSIYFGANNQLIRLDLSNSEMEILYDHNAQLYFSKVIGTKLFYSDDNFITLVFELSGQDQEA